MSDPLEKFRRKPGDIAQGSRDVPAEGAYVAFKAVDKRQERLKIRPAMRAWERVTYSYLLRILENGAFGTELALIYTFMVVEIKGRNLAPIADAIDSQQCTEIREYDPDYWPRPAVDDPAPFIESIKIHVKLPAEDAAQATAAMNERFSSAKH